MIKPELYWDTTKCPHCGSMAFDPILNPAKDVYLATAQVSKLSENVRGLKVGGSVITLAMKVCLNCGYIGFFRRKTVADED